MGLLFAIVVLITFTIVPVMLSARLMGAKRTGFGSSALAVCAAVAGNFLSMYFIADPLLAPLVSLVLMSVFFSAILGAKVVQSFFIAVVAVIIQVLIGFLLAAVGIAVDTQFWR